VRIVVINNCIVDINNWGLKSKSARHIQVGKTPMKAKPKALHWQATPTALGGRLLQHSRLAVSKLQNFFRMN
jgi:hypothetical protein